MKFLHIVYFLLTVLAFGFIGCTYQDGEKIPENLKDLQNLIVIQKNNLPETSIKFTRDLSIGGSNSLGTWYYDVSSSGWAFGGSDWFAGLEVDDRGNILVGDRYEKVIHIFDSGGNYVKKIGGEGNGPGEFESIFQIKIHSDQLLAFDRFQFRTTFFSINSLDLIEVQKAYINRAPQREELKGQFAHPVSLISDDLFIVGFLSEPRNANYGTEKYNLDEERSVRYYVMDREGKVISDMITELKDLKNITAVVDGRHLFNMRALPFLQQPMTSISNDGNIFTANSENPLIKMHDDKGDYIKAFYIPMEKKLIDRNEILNQFAGDDEENTNLLLKAELPEKWPALSGMVIDDEYNLWISTIPANDSLYEWLIINNAGKLIATFRWPGNRSIEKIKNGYVYARETQKSTGLQSITRYRIELEGI